MASRQFAHLRAKSLADLRAMTEDLPLTVADRAATREFLVHPVGSAKILCAGRFQIVATFLNGYAEGWRQGRIEGVFWKPGRA